MFCTIVRSSLCPRDGCARGRISLNPAFFLTSQGQQAQISVTVRNQPITDVSVSLLIL